MNSKYIVTILMSFIVGISILSQAAFVRANAQTNAPLTAPLTYFISGTVVYKYFRWFTPASNVTIEAKPIDSNIRYTIITDQKGQYSLPVPEGTYDIKAYDRFFTIFTPFYRQIEVYRDTTGINFMGIRK